MNNILLFMNWDFPPKRDFPTIKYFFNFLFLTVILSHWPVIKPAGFFNSHLFLHLHHYNNFNGFILKNCHENYTKITLNLILHG